MKTYERYVSFHHFFFLNNCIYLFLVALDHGLCLVAVSVGYSPWQCTGFSLGWLLLLGSIGSRHMGFHSCSTWVQQLHCADLSAWALVVPGHRLSSCSSQALECGCRSCGTRAQLPHSMWNLPGPGIEPMSPLFAGRQILIHCTTREVLTIS